jgi:hypothetical protein
MKSIIRVKTMNQQSVSTQTQLVLDLYANLRWQIACLEAKLKEIEPMAIAQVLDIIGNGKAANGKQIVYRTDPADITLQLRADKPKPEDHPDLECLKETIEIEAEKAQRQNAQKIAKVKKEIMVLEAHLVGLMQTDDGLKYVTEYEEKIRELTLKKPILSVRLK